ncbi:phage scaffolding protein [Latilactobacillus sakei]|uniref:phage scaffolding protein n=1 Tax=Latilactobacillus sakei TaxID=1599 RepID=UPI0012FD954C|nr:phage scaffolding protein [Latilactobacillus sakei]
MKREELKALGLEDSAIDKVMALHGQTVNGLNAQINTLNTEKETLTEQVSQSAKQLEDLSKDNADNAELQAQIKQLQDDKAQLESDSQTKLVEVQTNYAIESALKDAGARDVKAVLPFIDKDTIKLADGKLTGLDEQLKTVQADKDFLFQPTETKAPKPAIVTGQNSNPGGGQGGNSILETIQNNLAKGAE